MEVLSARPSRQQTCKNSPVSPLLSRLVTFTKSNGMLMHHSGPTRHEKSCDTLGKGMLFCHQANKTKYKEFNRSGTSRGERHDQEDPLDMTIPVYQDYQCAMLLEDNGTWSSTRSHRQIVLQYLSKSEWNICLITCV